MTPPIRKGDGTGLAPKGFAEVRKGDGTVLWSAGSAIPDSDLLHARYDATELSLSDGNSVSTWTDETGNGFDLTAGTAPTYRTGIINGNPIVRFEGVDDFLDAAWTALTQPNYIFIVTQAQNLADSEYLHDGENGTNRHVLNQQSGNWLLGSSSTNFTGSATDTNPHIFGEIFDGANSELRLDGATDATGDLGSDDLDGLTLGSQYNQGAWGTYDVGEILIYESQPTIADVETYLSDKWGITI